MRDEGRLLRCPQKELLHVSHVVETQSLDELRDVEDEDVRWIRPKDANRVLRSQWMRRILSERVEIQKALAREYKFPLSGKKCVMQLFFLNCIPPYTLPKDVQFKM